MEGHREWNFRIALRKHVTVSYLSFVKTFFDYFFFAYNIIKLSICCLQGMKLVIVSDCYIGFEHEYSVETLV